jgi:hypothetical protein
VRNDLMHAYISLRYVRARFCFILNRFVSNFKLYISLGL